MFAVAAQLKRTRCEVIPVSQSYRVRACMGLTEAVPLSIGRPLQLFVCSAQH